MNLLLDRNVSSFLEVLGVVRKVEWLFRPLGAP